MHESEKEDHKTCCPCSQVAENQPEAVSSSGPDNASKAPNVEQYVDELLARIQPAPASETRRKTVAQYVQDVIARAFLPAFEARFPIHFSLYRSISGHYKVSTTREARVRDIRCHGPETRH